MTTYLWHLLVAGYRGIGAFKTSKVASGTTTTIVDFTYEIGASEDDTAFILRDADGVAPEGEFQRVSSQSGTTITVDTAFSVAPAPGDRYGVADSVILLQDAIELVNEALRDIGRIGVVDTSQTTAANKTEYDIPVAAKTDLRKVEYNYYTDDSDDNQWVEIRDWDWVPAVAGSAATLLIPQPPASRTLRLTYMGLHPFLNAYNDVLQEAVPRQLAEAAVVYKFFDEITNQRQNADPTSQQGFNKAAAQYEEMIRAFRIWKPERKPRLFTRG